LRGDGATADTVDNIKNGRQRTNSIPSKESQSGGILIVIMRYWVFWCIEIIVSGRSAGQHIALAVTVKTIDGDKTYK
jgi:hypothetical protein